MKKVMNEIKKYISLFLCTCTLIVMILPVGEIQMEYIQFGIKNIQYSYYSLFAFRYGIVFPFICMILTVATLILIGLSHLKVIHPIAAFLTASASFVMSLLYLLVDLNVTYLTSIVTILQLAVAVFTFPLMLWIKDKE